MSSQKIIFRADGDEQIGMGHFTRTLALAEMLCEDYICAFATQKPSNYQITEIEKVCNSWIDLPVDNAHFDYFLEQLKGDEIVVLDNYYFDTDYQRSIKAKGCKLVCIDDKHHQYYACDLIINHTPLVSREDYSALNETNYALGLEYALLRKPFLQASLDKRSIDIEKKVFFICFGGTDYYNISLKILKVLDKYPTLGAVHVVTGVAHSKQKQIDQFCGNRVNFNHYHSLSAEEMVRVMKRCNIAIVPGSSILLEVLSVGLYPIIGYFVDNQKKSVKNFSKLNIAVSIGDFEEALEEKIDEVLKALPQVGIVENIQKHKAIFSKVKENMIMKFAELYT